MSITSLKNQSSAAAIGAVLLTLSIGTPATSATFNPAPLFDEVSTFTTSIPGDGDLADIYFPVLSTSSSSDDLLPIALFLQGANVDKSEYSVFASTVASYGFAVVVPNHPSDVFAPLGVPDGLFAEQAQIDDVLSYVRSENSNSDSPINGILDPDKLVLLGHSFGGIVGLNAIEGSCNFPTCLDDFTRPPELLGGAFYASALIQANLEGITPPLDNKNIPIALLAGELDGVTPFPFVEETFNQIQQPPKSLITVGGANHYSITNRNNPPGPVIDPNIPTLEQSVAIETIARWSSLFLRGYALGDEGALEYVNQTGDLLDANVSVVSQDVPEHSSILGVLSFGGIFLGFARYRSLRRS
ncbi:MAG: chlorophyllase [Cyanobacteria bacterium P01_F01_bin.86]